MTSLGLSVLAGCAVGALLGILMLHRRNRAGEQRREQYWRQQLNLEREQSQAYIAELTAIQAEHARLLASHQRTLQKLVDKHKKSLIAKDQEHRAAIAKLTMSQKPTTSATVKTNRTIANGQVTERFVSVGSHFKYKTADTRCLGDLIDYVVFDGCSDINAGHKQADALSIVFLAIQADVLALTPQQRAIAQAIAAGRVRFEILPSRPPALLLLANRSEQVLQPASNLDELDELDEPKFNAHLIKTKIETSVDHHAYRRAYQSWLEEEDKLLKLRYAEGKTIHSIATELQRKPSAIRSRLRKLGQI